jgi:nitrogen fixation/metabolism regulation signal transduction histidine kinase
VSPRRRNPLAHETQVALWALAGGLPALLVALALLWTGDHRGSTKLLVTTALTAVWFGCAIALRERVSRPLQTLSNMIAALHERDYSIRARGGRTDSALGLAFLELNALADAMRRQRLDAIEATALLRQVMEAIDVAVFAFDPERRLQLVNRGGEQLIGLPVERAVGRPAAEIGLAAVLEGETPRLTELAFPGQPRRWEVRRGTYRWEGRPHTLLVLSDLTRSLREEERLAWQRLVRVLSHEINNSLAPIKSIAGSLRGGLQRRAGRRPEDAPPAAHDAGDGTALDDGLAVIESRAEALGRFIQAYARLARLPKPVPGAVDVGAWARRVVSLETRLPVNVPGGPALTIMADQDQLDALLINLVRNAVDAALETGGMVQVSWRREDDWFALAVEDEGPGLAETANLFVPFFTTKPGGTGIGLALCRQIAEAHGGSVTLLNRSEGCGCIATLRLPASRVAGPEGGREDSPSERRRRAAAARRPAGRSSDLRS